MTQLPCLIRGLVVVLVALAAESVTGQEGGLVAPGAKVERIATGFGFLEGPAADADGNLYYYGKYYSKYFGSWHAESMAGESGLTHDVMKIP